MTTGALVPFEKTFRVENGSTMITGTCIPENLLRKIFLFKKYFSRRKMIDNDHRCCLTGLSRFYPSLNPGDKNGLLFASCKNCEQSLTRF